VIPPDWHVDFRGTGVTDWKKNDTTGHYWKISNADSTCALESEEDWYNFKPIKGVSRTMSIYTRFASGMVSGTIRFDYEVGDSTKTITRQQADSIFAAEKIQKDY
jgi:hypothetical protein